MGSSKIQNSDGRTFLDKAGQHYKSTFTFQYLKCFWPIYAYWLSYVFLFFILYTWPDYFFNFLIQNDWLIQHTGPISLFVTHLHAICMAFFLIGLYFCIHFF